MRVACDVAARFGVFSAAPVVLRDGSNVLVHLAPAPVVARIASLTGDVRPDVRATLAKDLALADHLARRGAPVVAPSRELPPGPHERHGRHLTFWTYVEHDPDHVWQPADMGPLLAELHAELRGFPGALPTAPPLDMPEVIGYLAAHDSSRSDPILSDPILSDRDLADLAADAERVTAEIRALGDEAVPLHGDAHPGNLLSTADGPVWTDFEDAWRGPVGWDLACLARTGRLDGRLAVAGYPHAPADIEPYVRARLLQGLGWVLVFASRFPDRVADARARIREWRRTR